MAIDIGGIVQRGYERTVARNGLLFAAILFVISLLDAMFSTGVQQPAEPTPGMAPSGMAPIRDVTSGAPPVSLGLGSGAAGFLSMLVGLVGLVVTIAAIRTFVSDETQELPREHFTENILWPAVNLVIGSIVFGIAVGIGLILLVIPGLFLLVSLFFWEVFVAVENDNFIEGLRRSWELTGGRRLHLFALGVVVLVVALIVSIAFAIPSVLLPDILSFIIQEIGSALVGVFILATVGEAYNQLIRMDNEEGEARKSVKHKS